MKRQGRRGFRQVCMRQPLSRDGKTSARKESVEKGFASERSVHLRRRRYIRR